MAQTAICLPGFETRDSNWFAIYGLYADHSWLIQKRLPAVRGGEWERVCEHPRLLHINAKQWFNVAFELYLWVTHLIET